MNNRVSVAGVRYLLDPNADIDELKRRLVSAIRSGAEFIALPVIESLNHVRTVDVLVSSGVPIVFESTVAHEPEELVHAGAATAQTFMPEDDWYDL